MSKPLDVLCAVIEKDGRFLIARRKKGELKGKWEFPGGKLKLETHKGCLHRELEEEFGIEIEVREYLGENIHSYPQNTIRLIGYYARHVSGKFELREHDAIAWVFPSKLKEYDLADADIPLADKIITSD